MWKIVVCVHSYYRDRLFSQHPLVAVLSEALLTVFVSIEMTGQGVSFEQKFNYRRPMYAVLKYIWERDVHRTAMQVTHFCYYNYVN